MYNDGVKTIIQFPKTIFLAKPNPSGCGKEGGLFSKDETQQVNLRTQGDRTIVDGLFDKAYIGNWRRFEPEKVTITVANNESSNEINLCYERWPQAC